MSPLETSPEKSEAIPAEVVPEKTREERITNFIDYYTDPKSDTYDNAARSYMRAFDNPNYASSAVLAFRLVSKCTAHIARSSLEKRNFGLNKMIEFAAAMTIKTKSATWFDRLMTLTNYAKPAAQVNFNNFLTTGGSPIKSVIDGEEEPKEVKQFDTDFAGYLKDKYKNQLKK